MRAPGRPPPLVRVPSFAPVFCGKGIGSGRVAGMAVQGRAGARRVFQPTGRMVCISPHFVGFSWGLGEAQDDVEKGGVDDKSNFVSERIGGDWLVERG